MFRETGSFEMSVIMFIRNVYIKSEKIVIDAKIALKTDNDAIRR